MIVSLINGFHLDNYHRLKSALSPRRQLIHFCYSAEQCSERWSERGFN